MKPLAKSALYTGHAPTALNDHHPEVVEVSLLLSRSQMVQLANQAHRRGISSAQFLRQCITTMCQSTPDAS